MKVASLRVTASDLRGHLAEGARSLASAAGLPRHVVQFELLSEPGADGDVQVRLQASPDTIPVINQRDVRESAVEFWKTKDTGEALCFGYSEAWSNDSKHRRLINAAARFFYRSDSARSFVQLLRFEWADALWISSKREYEYPAKGAGTPHWHYDGLQAEDEMRELVALRELLHAAPSTPVVKEFGDSPEPAEQRSMKSLPGWFGSVHFPVAARWQKNPLTSLDFTALDINPHASSPADLASLRNMMSSAILYVRHQAQECC